MSPPSERPQRGERKPTRAIPFRKKKKADDVDNRCTFCLFPFLANTTFFRAFFVCFFSLFFNVEDSPEPSDRREAQPPPPPPRIFFVKLLPIVRPVELERQYKAMEHNRSTAPGDRWCTSRFRLFRKPYEGLVFRGEPSFK